jgi:hypothetical protein
VRFQESEDSIESSLLDDCICSTATYSVGTYPIDMDGVTTGKWFFIKADKAIAISLSGGAAITLLAGKPNRMFAEFTSFSVTVTTEETRITIAIAGE